MKLKELENKIIECIKQNIELSGDTIDAPITTKTSPLNDIKGFDSLRAIEVALELETVFECDLPPEKLFANTNSDPLDIGGLAKSLEKILLEAENHE